MLACKARLEVITKTTIEHFQKWCLTDKRGLQLCLHIEGIKTKLLEQMNTSTEGNSSEFTLYPATMKPHCNNLSIIATICRDIAVKTKESLKQLKALSKLPGSCNEIFYRSWELDEFIEFLTELAGRYEKEAEIRLAVAGKGGKCSENFSFWLMLAFCSRKSSALYNKIGSYTLDFCLGISTICRFLCP